MKLVSMQTLVLVSLYLLTAVKGRLSLRYEEISQRHMQNSRDKGRKGSFLISVQTDGLLVRRSEKGEREERHAGRRRLVLPVL